MQRRLDDMAPMCYPPWAIFLPFLMILFAVKLILKPSKSKAPQLPPGPPLIFALTTIAWQWLSKDQANMDDILSKLWAKYGPIISIRLPFFKPFIFIADRSLAHDALVRRGAVFSDRPPSPGHSITFAPHGPLWRSLRRNLASETLHASRLTNYTDTRKLVLQMLLEELHGARQASGIVAVKQSVDFAMFSLLAFMSFGKKLDFDVIRQMQDVLRGLFSPLLFKTKVAGVFPKITGMVFRKSVKKMLEIFKEQHDFFMPLIRGRDRREGRGDHIGGADYCYIDSLLELSVAEEGGRRLSEEELVGLCREFLVAGSHTTAATLEWTMAELVKHQEIQEKLSEEIQRVLVGKEEGSIVEEEDLARMPYLRAVILEVLRLHPGTSFLIPHATTEDVEIGGYVVPKESTVFFMLTELARDEKVWADPMEFKPERFLAGGEGEGVDITCSKEIKMMTFGAGRRICPGLGIAMLHLHYFVANLVREFEWKAVDGEEVDLSEKWELTVSMKNHLRADLVPRQRSEKFPM